MKYIIIEDIEPIVFSEATTHREASYVSGARKVTGAGFCSARIDSNGASVSIWGKSVSLGIGPGKDDEFILKRLFEQT